MTTHEEGTVAKITTSGASMDPMDATNARPSEEAYNDAMTRHGTPAFSEQDRQLVDRYQAIQLAKREQDRGGDQREAGAGEADHLAGRHDDDRQGTEGGERPSDGSNSSTGERKPASASAKPKTSGR